MLFSSYIAVPSAVIVLLPLSLKRDMSAFRYVSLASIGALFYTGIVLIAELPAYYKEFKPKSEVVAAYWDLNIFTGASMTFFAYTCQVQMLPIYSELVNPSYSRMRKVIQRSIATDFLFYLVIAVAGYLSQFNNTAEIVLERPALAGSGTDYALLIAVVSVMACIMVAFPVNYNPFRQHFFNCVFGRETFS